MKKSPICERLNAIRSTFISKILQQSKNMYFNPEHFDPRYTRNTNLEINTFYFHFKNHKNIIHIENLKHILQIQNIYSPATLNTLINYKISSDDFNFRPKF